MLDHIVFTPGFQVLRHDVVVDEDAIHVSDHSPVYADLSVRMKGQYECHGKMLLY
jgi:endonuclease/exonuclease/phosphatase family metal-dependent hydrolase